MKKKTKKSTKRKQKIDVALESLLNLEYQIKELIKRVEQLEYSQLYYPHKPQQPNQPNPWFKPEWPSTDQPIIWQNTVTMSKEQHSKTHYEKAQ